jgi:uncharacterized membrane protein
MAFCANCGSDVQGRFCAKCGTPVAAAGEPDSGASAAGPPPPGAHPYSQSQGGGLTENMAGALAYLMTVITGILFLALSPYNQSKFVRFHAFQSIFFFVAWMAFWIIVSIVTIILPSVLSAMVWLLSTVVWLGGMAVWIILMVKAYNGERFKLPVIGDLAEKQA